jgi:hypothetical protein
MGIRYFVVTFKYRIPAGGGQTDWEIPIFIGLDMKFIPVKKW